MAKRNPEIGLALGGGAAHGFAHIPILEALDELGVRPSVIAGASMGAVIGAAYAAGHGASDIADYVAGLTNDRGTLMRRIWRSRPRTLRHLFGPHRGTAGQLDGVTILAEFADLIPRDFAALATPLKVVATDFYGWHEVVLTEGSLTQAVAASMALPPLIRPVMIGGRAMIDGGVVNPLPFEHAAVDFGVVVAVDVIGGPQPRGRAMPRRLETVIGAIQLTMRQITAEKLRGRRPPDILIEPSVDRFRLLEFGKAAEIMAAAAPAKEALKRRLEALFA